MAKQAIPNTALSARVARRIPPATIQGIERPTQPVCVGRLVVHQLHVALPLLATLSGTSSRRHRVRAAVRTRLHRTDRLSPNTFAVSGRSLVRGLTVFRVRLDVEPKAEVRAADAPAGPREHADDRPAASAASPKRLPLRQQPLVPAAPKTFVERALDAPSKSGPASSRSA